MGLVKLQLNVVYRQHLKASMCNVHSAQMAVHAVTSASWRLN